MAARTYRRCKLLLVCSPCLFEWQYVHTDGANCCLSAARVSMLLQMLTSPAGFFKRKFLPNFVKEIGLLLVDDIDIHSHHSPTLNPKPWTVFWKRRKLLSFALGSKHLRHSCAMVLPPAWWMKNSTRAKTKKSLTTGLALFSPVVSRSNLSLLA